MKFLASVPDGSNRGWKVPAGFEKGGVSAQEKMGVRVEYGTVRDDKDNVLWDQWRWCENGGAAPALYLVLNGKVLVGLKKAERPIAEGLYWETDRGFSDPKDSGFESPLVTAQRELSEVDESNFTVAVDRFTCLGGPYNMNTAVICHGPGRGVTFYGVAVYRHEIEIGDDGSIRLKPGVTTNKGASRTQFLPMDFVMDYLTKSKDTQCGMSMLALSLLKLRLLETGQISL